MREVTMCFDCGGGTLPGFHRCFRESCEGERGHAEKLMMCQSEEGDRIIQCNERPDRDEWGGGPEAVETALDLARSVSQMLLVHRRVADGLEDARMMEFIESKYQEGRVDADGKICDDMSNLRRVGPRLDQCMFDWELLQ
jgi:hypothetical protein